MSRILGANWGGQVGLLQMRDLGVWERSGNRLHAGQVAAAVGEVVVRHTAAKNTSNQECDIAPKMRHRPMSHGRPGHTLLLAPLSEVKLGIFSIAAMIAFSPSIFPSSQMRLPAKL